MDLNGLSIKETENGCTLTVKVIPRSSRDGIMGVENGELKIKLSAPPVEGAANEAAIGYLAGILKRPKKGLEIIRGEKSRHKVIRIQGLGPGELRNLLAERLNGAEAGK